jgi:hypothetical protein
MAALFCEHLPGALPVSRVERRSLGGGSQARTPPVTLGRALLAAAAGPCAWFVDLSTRFFLVEFGAAREHEGVLIGVGVFFCLVALVASVACLRLSRRVKGHGGEVELVAMLGVALGLFTAITIGAALVPHYFFDGAASP